MFKAVCYNTGSVCRGAGQHLDRFGCMIQGNLAHRETLSRHRRLVPMQDKIPSIGQDSFVAPDAAVIGEVKVGSKCSIWYGTVIRGDRNEISIGEMSSLGDRCVVTSSNGYLPASDKALWTKFATKIGNRCIVDPGSILHACVLEDECIIESGAMVFEGAVVGRHSIVGAGSVVPQGSHIPSGELWSGIPALFERTLTEEEIAAIPKIALTQFELAMKHDEEHVKTPQKLDEEKRLEEHFSESATKPPELN